MGAGSARYGVAVLILVILWIAVYWWTPAPAPDPVISFGELPQTPRLASGQSPVGQPAIRFDEPVAPPISGPATSEAPKPIDTPPAASAQPKAPSSSSGVIPPAFRDYTVRAGDTAESISRRFYGTGDYWQQVMKANPRVDFTRLRAGKVVRVPVDPGNIQGVPDKNSPPPAPAIEYRVKSGDTLSDIASEIYGRASLWTVIRDANRDAVGDDGSRLRPGMVLKIPPAPQGARR